MDLVESQADDDFTDLMGEEQCAYRPGAKALTKNVRDAISADLEFDPKHPKYGIYVQRLALKREACARIWAAVEATLSLYNRNFYWELRIKGLVKLDEAEGTGDEERLAFEMDDFNFDVADGIFYPILALLESTPNVADRRS
ncbi:hypothetical protein DL98DRAFT_536018 [Cadophora sp. DSE1049]|nr:hypothetical protein DL98DRAFT_536018 [Cadophora sp. DSE1049]